MRVRSPAAAFAARKRLRDELDETLLPAFAKVFDELVPGTEVVHIPRLELHVRVASLDDLAAALPEVLRRELQATLRALPGRGGGPAAAEPAAAWTRTAAQESRIEAIVHYLLTGALPWSVESAERGGLARWLRPVSAEEAALVAGAVRAHPEPGGRWMDFHFRLLQLLPEVEWVAFATALCGAELTPAAEGDGPATLPGSEGSSARADLVAGRTGEPERKVFNPHAELPHMAGAGEDFHVRRSQLLPEAERAPVATAIAGGGEREAGAGEPVFVAAIEALAAAGTLSRYLRLKLAAAAFSAIRGGVDAASAAHLAAILEEISGAEPTPGAAEGEGPRMALGSEGAVPRAGIDRGGIGEPKRKVFNPHAALVWLPERARALFRRLLAGAPVEPPVSGGVGPAGMIVRDIASGDVTSVGMGVRDVASGGAASAGVAPATSAPATSAPATGAPGTGSPALIAELAPRPVVAGEGAGPGKGKGRDSPLLPRVTVTPPRPADEPFGVMVASAGLSLLHPFIPRLFETTKIRRPGDPALPAGALPRAAALLCFLATGDDEGYEHELGFIKVLLGLPLDAPLPIASGLVTAADREEAEALLDAAIEHWSALGRTSRDGLRASFLQRRGLLREEETGHRLQVEPAAFDMLLRLLPWGMGVIRLPWMRKPIFTEWAAP